MNSSNSEGLIVLMGLPKPKSGTKEGREALVSHAAPLGSEARGLNEHIQRMIDPAVVVNYYRQLVAQHQ